MFQRFTILLVDSDRAHAKLLAKELARAGHHVLAARNGDHAYSILQYRGFDFLVVSVEDSWAGELDLISWARQLYPRPHVAAFGKGESQSEMATALKRGASLYLAKPVDSDRLTSYLSRSGVKRSFSGTVDAVDILEYVQFVMLSGRETILEVISRLGTRGLIFFKGGRALHATCGTFRGEEAFYRCMEFKGGTFSHLSWYDPEEITMNLPGDSLLMEAARRRDHQRCEDVSGEDEDSAHEAD